MRTRAFRSLLRARVVRNLTHGRRERALRYDALAPAVLVSIYGRVVLWTRRAYHSDLTILGADRSHLRCEGNFDARGVTDSLTRRQRVVALRTRSLWIGTSAFISVSDGGARSIALSRHTSPLGHLNVTKVLSWLRRSISGLQAKVSLRIADRGPGHHSQMLHGVGAVVTGTRICSALGHHRARLFPSKALAGTDAH